MKTLFIGGIKSGKSFQAEQYALKHATKKPLYLATNEFFDDEMKERVQKHQEQRGDAFITQEEPLQLYSIIANRNSLVLVECVSMWINNMLYHKQNEEQIREEIEQLLQLKTDIVFVMNDVSCSIVSENSLTRNFVDINGRIAQILASKCDAVYNTVAGLSVKIK